MIKAVIFDFNGTMFFDADKHVVSWRAFAKAEFGADIKDEDFDKHIHGFSNADILEFLSGHRFSKEEVLAYATKKELYYQQICEEDEKNLHLVDGLAEFLDELKEASIPVYICTASMKPNVDWYVKTFHLEKWFPTSHIIYDDGTIKRGKPDPEIYLRAVKQTGCSASECLVFEDAISGIRSSYGAGVTSIVGIKSEEEKPLIQDLPGVFEVVPDFRNLPSSVRSLLSI